MSRTGWNRFLHFALAHHEERMETACWRVGHTSWWVCARCAGLYPAMFLTLLVEPFFLPHLSRFARAAIFFLTVFPAWIAWAHDQLHPQHPWPRRAATATGAVAGFGAGLELWAHIRDPFHSLFTFILVLTGISSAGVWALGRFLNGQESPGTSLHPPEE